MKLTVGMNPVFCQSCGGSDFEKVQGEINLYKCLHCGNTSEFYSIDPSEHNVTPGSLLKKAYLELKSRDFVNAEKDFRRVLDRAPNYASAWFGIVLAKHKCIDRADLYGDDMTNRYLSGFPHDSTYTWCPTVKDIRMQIIRYLGDNMDRALETQNIADRNSFEQVLSAASQKTLDKYNGQKYEYGIQLCTTRIAENYLIACRVFRELGDYLDSPARYQDCFQKSKELKYNDAVKRMKNAHTLTEFQELYQVFEECGDYRSSRPNALICRKSIRSANLQKKISKFFRVLTSFFLICSVLAAFIFLSKELIELEINETLLGLLFILIPYFFFGMLASVCYPWAGYSFGDMYGVHVMAGIGYSLILFIIASVYEGFHLGLFIFGIILSSLFAAFVDCVVLFIVYKISSWIFRLVLGKRID